MRYFVEFSYRGTEFHGSQTQPNGVTVQETMEKAFTILFRTPVSLVFAGRTDAGVHAEQMFAHFDCQSLPMNENELVSRLNNLLPPSIALRAVVRVTDEAHARFSALSRTYEYRTVDQKNPFLVGLATRVVPGLDYKRMNQGARLLLGKKDFASFCKVHTDVKTTICDVTRAEWENGIFTITADRFLRNMVRAVVGTLLDLGRGKIAEEDLNKILQQKNRCSAGQSAPSEGLYLVHIDYPENIFIR
ncbi:MAG: tRNA pseudouridine(38-40) synthase TruA [Paludibacteraceae bacterium]|nr:tRNA pseudouridine(38-40) synthase TruA [Paludibacteraceae bacterium]